MPYLGIFNPKAPYLGIFGQELWKNYCHIWNQQPQTCLFAKFHQKTKMPDLCIFGLGFENNIVIIQISTLKFVYLQNFTEKQKCLNFELKMLYLGIFGEEF